MAYEKTNWQNSPSTNTPLNADNLNHIEQGVADAHDEVNKLYDITRGITASSGAITTLMVPGSSGKTSNIVLSEGLTYYITDITPNATSGTMSAFVEGHTETAVAIGPGVPGVLTAPATGYL